MGKFNRDNRSDRDFSKNRFDRGNRGSFGSKSQMHSTICSACGRNCEVPFKPTGEKPVFCSECFNNKKEGGFNRQARTESRFSSNNQKPFGFSITKEQFEQVNFKLDRIIKILAAQEKPDNHEEKEEAKIVKKTSKVKIIKEKEKVKAKNPPKVKKKKK